MGSSTVGIVSREIIGGPITIKGITPTTASTTATSATATRTILPKGTYAVTLVINGTASFGSSPGSGYVSVGNGVEFTVLTSYADTGRPGPVLVSTDRTAVLSNILVLNRDAYVQVGVKNESSYALFQCDIVFTPTYTPFKSLGTITGNRTQAGTSGTTDTGDINFGTMQLGWDYDRNAPMLITASNSGTSSSQNTRSTAFYLWRYNSDGTWGYTYWNSVSAASGNAWYNGNGIGYRGTQNNYRWSSFFIKNGELHNLDMAGLMTDAGSLRWGWIKGTITSGTTSGSTLTMSPGHTNTAFATSSSSIDSGTSNIMIYYHDIVNNKVIYNGARSNSFNGAWGGYGWIHNWAQWDIATNTVDYQNVNGTVDPSIAGSTTTLAWDAAVPDGSTGFSYAIGDNSGSAAYLAKWNRTGTYTGVGNFTLRDSYMPQNASTRSYSNFLSTYSRIQYLPGGIMTQTTGGNTSSVTVEHSTGTNVPLMTCDSLTSFPSNRWHMNSTTGTNSERTYTLVAGNTIVLAQVAFVKYSTAANNTVARIAPITIMVAPATTSNLGLITPRQGGIGTAANPTGINNGG
jgi:hypothetical protein